jgi:hypothetical protein
MQRYDISYHVAQQYRAESGWSYSDYMHYLCALADDSRGEMLTFSYCERK